MYHHSLLFIIVSENEEIENTLSKIEPLEDCSYTFRTVGHTVTTSQNPDTAVIYDCIGKAEFSMINGDFDHHILVAEAGSQLLADKQVVFSASDLWVMPEKTGYNSEFITLYFERLAREMKKDADARKQGICFDTIINSVPDIAWFKDTLGAHLIVNDSFCEMVGKTKKQIYKQGHCYIWDASKEDEAVCLSSDQIIMESRRTNTFDENIKTKNDMRMLKSYKSALIDVDGRIFGTCGIAHDITELKNMSTELDIVLDSIPYAVLVENTQDIVLNKNNRFDEYFPKFVDIVGKSSGEWKKSLSKKLLLDESLKEIVTLTGKEDDDERVLVFDEEPIIDAFEQVVGKIVTLTDITLERSISRKNEYSANTDYLTGLNNRRKLMSYIENIYENENLSFVMMDLDNFKQVNDVYGHGEGDKALIKTADTLRECFKDDFIARMGGDEFMVVILDKEIDEVKAQTENMLNMMRSEYQAQKEFSSVTASAGILCTCMLPKQKRDIYDILHMVDETLYKAKNGGKNRYCVYGED